MKRKPELEDAEDAARKKVKPNLKDKLSGNEISSSSTSTPETSTLQPLLDFSSLNDTPSIQKRFDLIGRAILRDFYLVVQCGDTETLFEILELEFYLQKAECHEDPFTHGSEEQKISGKWYFHRAPRRSADSTRSSTSLTGYRGGTRKGLDLTLGAPCEVSSPFFASTAPTGSGSTTQPLLRGGALLRSIRRVSDSKVISGPSLLVDQVLLLSKAATIADLVDQKWDSDTSAFRSTPGPPERAASLFLRPRPPSASPKADIFRSPRIGLDLSHPGTTVSPTHPRVIFLSRPYRYFVHPHLLTANGRTQTFLGVLQSTLNGSFAATGQTLHGMKLRSEVARLTGLQNTTVASYISEYQGGIDYGKLKTWVGLKGASGSPSKYLSMMGTLERLRRESDAI